MRLVSRVFLRTFVEAWAWWCSAPPRGAGSFCVGADHPINRIEELLPWNLSAESLETQVVTA